MKLVEYCDGNHGLLLHLIYHPTAIHTTVFQNKLSDPKHFNSVRPSAKTRYQIS